MGELISLRTESRVLQPTLPNFLGIGVQRAATTWLYNCFQQHPEIFVPPNSKEICYFSRFRQKKLQWYSDHFSGSESYPAVGEITPTYLHAAAITDIHALLPEAKIIVILREPVRRAYSAYRLFNQSLGATSFRDACRPETNLVKLSFYADALEELFRHYPSSQVKVVLHDDVREDSEAVLSSLFDFLGVDPLFRPEKKATNYNAMVFPRVQRTFSSLGLSGISSFLRRSPLANSVRSLAGWMESRRIRSDRKAMNDLRPLFREDILRTEKIIGRDLGHWLEDR